MTERPPESDALVALNRFFIDALLALGRNNRGEEACRLAAAAWSALRHGHPREAERLNGVLHALTRDNHPQKPNKGDNHVPTENP